MIKALNLFLGVQGLRFIRSDSQLDLSDVAGLWTVVHTQAHKLLGPAFFAFFGPPIPMLNPEREVGHRGSVTFLAFSKIRNWSSGIPIWDGWAPNSLNADLRKHL